jgi:hypothetical protein
VDADHAGRQERLRVKDRSVDVRFGGEVDDGVGVVDQRPDDDRVGDVALDEAEPPGQLGIVEDRREVGHVAGVGQLVEDGDHRVVAAAQDVADVARPDEPGAAGDQQPAERPGLGRHVSQLGG